MTGVATRAPERADERIGASPATRPPGRRAAGAAEVPGSSPGTRSRIGMELALFAAIGALGVLQWSRLVADPDVGRLLLALAVVTGGGAAMAALWATGRRVPYTRVAALAIAVLATAAATVVVGLPARLLSPSNWPELIDNLGTSTTARKVQLYNGRAQIGIKNRGRTVISVSSEGFPTEILSRGLRG